VPYAREVEKDNEFATKAKTWGIKNESAAVEVYAALRLNKSIMPNHTYNVLLIFLSRLLHLATPTLSSLLDPLVPSLQAIPPQDSSVARGHTRRLDRGHQDW
jgi:hypothetical protein